MCKDCQERRKKRVTSNQFKEVKKLVEKMICLNQRLLIVINPKEKQEKKMAIPREAQS